MPNVTEAFSIDDLPPDAQRRIREMTAEVGKLVDTLDEYVPFLAPHFKMMGLLVIKAHGRAEMAEHRLTEVEKKLASAKKKRKPATGRKTAARRSASPRKGVKKGAS